MRMVGGIVTLAAAGLMLAGTALAQDVSTSKTAVDTFVENLYGKFQLRHKTKVVVDDGEVDKVTPVLQLRPQLGAKFLNDKLDANVIFVYQKETETTSVKEGAHEYYIEYTTIDSPYGTLDPYIWGYLPTNGNGTVINVGTYGFLATPDFETPIGKFYARAEIETVVTQNSRETNTTVRNTGALDSERLALAGVEEGDTLTVKQEDPSGYFAQQYRIGVKITDALDVNVRTLYERDFTPDYTTVTDGGVELDGYKVTDYIMNRYVASYKFANGMSLTNELRHFINGLYESGTKTGDALPRYENRLMLTTDLF